MGHHVCWSRASNLQEYTRRLVEIRVICGMNLQRTKCRGIYISLLGE
jgi:hypothetical protein